MRLIRQFVKIFVLAWEKLTSPARGKRSNQQEIAEELAKHSIYQFVGCPFCVRVRHEMRRLDLPVTLKDAKDDPRARADLLQGGGKIQAPCMRIEGEDGQVQWMYESNDIIIYLRQTFPLV